MEGREGEPNRQQPKLNSLRIQGPLSKTFLIPVVVQKSKSSPYSYILATLAHYKGCNILSS
jgi:hypothetical protein